MIMQVLAGLPDCGQSLEHTPGQLIEVRDNMNPQRFPVPDVMLVSRRDDDELGKLA